MVDFLRITFPVSGVETYAFIPPLVAFIISFFTSMGGISGAFLILPFQMSVLGFTTPSVSSTNFLYNIVGIPGGVYRYIHEKRMAWPLTWVIVAGTLPGVLMGFYVRVKYLPDPKNFKLFVGMVLLYIALRLLRGLRHRGIKRTATEEKTFVIRNVSYGLKRIEYDFADRRVSFSTLSMFFLSLTVGIVSGIYGIGGGSIIAPFCISMFRLPIHTVAGAVLMGTFVTSISGVAYYTAIPMNNGMTAPPDWLLGFLFGVGGLCGMYLGARAQKFIPELAIKVVLALIIFSVSIKYILQFFQ
jgi:uncharacterized membrane protein YfcA